MSPLIDFTGVSTSFEPMPAGEHDLVVDEVELVEKTATSKNDYWKVTWKVPEGEGEYEGRKQFRNFSVERQSLWALKKFMVEAGLPEEDLEGPLDLNELMPRTVGSRMTLELTQREYQGDLRNDVKKFRASDF